MTAQILQFKDHVYTEYEPNAENVIGNEVYMHIKSKRTGLTLITTDFKIPVYEHELQAAIKFYLHRFPHWELVENVA